MCIAGVGFMAEFDRSHQLTERIGAECHAERQSREVQVAGVGPRDKTKE
jgi:hypothetical protein